MPDQVCLIHYHELGLKGHNRYIFERQLRDNIAAALVSFSNENPETDVSKVERVPGRLLIEVHKGSAKDIASLIASIPGVARVSIGVVCGRDTKEMCKTAERVLAAQEPFETFKVAARRSNTDFPINSMELNQIVGAHLCENFPDKGVKMKGQDVTVRVEVVQGHTYVYASTVKGVGGLPVGSGGNIISLLSAGIDSPVATWRMIRRGAVVTGVHFSGRPQIADTSEQLVKEIGDVLSKTGGLGRIYVVPFGDIQKEVSLNAPPKLRILLYRRLMIAVAERIAAIEGAKALVTGESLGQVASQTLANIQCVDEVATLPVLRPLIGNDKQEIIDDAKRIGTFEISTQDAEDCCTLFMPRKPETQGRVDEVVKAYTALPYEKMIDEALDALEWIDFDSPVYKAPKELK